jgi:hypothetical protein
MRVILSRYSVFMPIIEIECGWLPIMTNDRGFEIFARLLENQGFTIGSRWPKFFSLMNSNRDWHTTVVVDKHPSGGYFVMNTHLSLEERHPRRTSFLRKYVTYEDSYCDDGRTLLHGATNIDIPDLGEAQLHEGHLEAIVQAWVRGCELGQRLQSDRQ